MNTDRSAQLSSAAMVFVTGSDAEGKSRIIEQIPLDRTGAENTVRTAFEMDGSRPAQQVADSADAVHLDLGLNPGQLRWRILERPANWEWAEMHHTDTVDFHTIVHGELELILDDGVHLLRAGDSVVVNGIDHAWRAGATGFTSMILIVGTQPS